MNFARPKLRPNRALLQSALGAPLVKGRSNALAHGTAGAPQSAPIGVVTARPDAGKGPAMSCNWPRLLLQPVRAVRRQRPQCAIALPRKRHLTGEAPAVDPARKIASAGMSSSTEAQPVGADRLTAGKGQR